jgi:hypothetical protein
VFKREGIIFLNLFTSVEWNGNPLSFMEIGEVFSLSPPMIGIGSLQYIILKLSHVYIIDSLQKSCNYSGSGLILVMAHI